MSRILLVFALLASALGCATSPLGRRQLTLYGSGTMSKLGAQSFDQLKTDVPISKDPVKNAYVNCVADAIVGILEPSDGGPTDWEVVVFEDESANAFALPGGKIGVHTGLLAVATNQDQLAAVIGHEVGHVLAKHSNERMSQTQFTQLGLAVAGAVAANSELSPAQRKALGLLGVGAQYGILLPYSRTHESEADLIGLDLMARAGFEPGESVSLWQNMSQGGAQPPELLSTHPSHETRILDLRERIPSANALRDAAHSNGRRPACRPTSR